jgi:hypothetical protein
VFDDPEAASADGFRRLAAALGRVS